MFNLVLFVVQFIFCLSLSPDSVIGPFPGVMLQV